MQADLPAYIPNAGRLSGDEIAPPLQAVGGNFIESKVANRLSQNLLLRSVAKFHNSILHELLDWWGSLRGVRGEFGASPQIERGNSVSYGIILGLSQNSCRARPHEYASH